GGRRGASSQPSGPQGPGTIDDLPAILDRLTTQQIPVSVGRINVSTAPKPVLMGLTDLGDDTIERMVAARSQLDGPSRATPAWLVQQGVITGHQLRRLLPKITSESATYSVEAVGYADHVDTFKRIYMILEMRGPIGQVLYYRDLSGLGPAY